MMPDGIAFVLTRSAYLQPLNDGLDAGVGPDGSIERVREGEIDSTDVRRGALHQPLDRRLPVAQPHEGVGDQVESKVGEIPAARRGAGPTPCCASSDVEQRYLCHVRPIRAWRGGIHIPNGAAD